MEASSRRAARDAASGAPGDMPLRAAREEAVKAHLRMRAPGAAREEPSEEQVAEVLSAADRDGSGTIDYGEFCERAFFEARPRFAEMGPDDGREALL